MSRLWADVWGENMSGPVGLILKRAWTVLECTPKPRYEYNPTTELDLYTKSQFLGVSRRTGHPCWFRLMIREFSSQMSILSILESQKRYSFVIGL